MISMFFDLYWDQHSSHEHPIYLMLKKIIYSTYS